LLTVARGGLIRNIVREDYHTAWRSLAGHGEILPVAVKRNAKMPRVLNGYVEMSEVVVVRLSPLTPQGPTFSLV
jgi:hypothetical protein